MNDLNQMELGFLTSSSVAPPAKTSAWLGVVLDWVENEVASSTNNAESLMNSLPLGFAGKTSLVLSPPTKEPTSQRSLEDSLGTPQLFPLKDGKQEVFVSAPNVSPSGGCLTLRTSESHSAAVACSLSLVLEPWHDGLLKFCLSQKASSGILRRATQRGKKMPPRLVEALQELAGGEDVNHQRVHS